MAGYRRQRTTYRLKFEDPAMEGLEVVARSASVQTLLTITSLADAATENPETKVVHEVLALFGDSLVSWNLEDGDGTPVPADVMGLAGQDMDFVLAVIMAWVQAVSQVRAPLPAASGIGPQPAPEASLPMEPLPSSPPN
jgi:hypothetical protein